MNTLIKQDHETIDYEALGLFVDLFGSGRGISSAGDIITSTTDGVDLNTLWDEFQETLLLWNAGRQRIVDILTYPVTDLVEEEPLVEGDDFEEASEFGVAQSMRPDIDYTYLGYTFKWYDKASRFTWKFLADAPANRVQAQHALALEADNRLIFREVMKRLFSNANTTNKEGVPVKAFWNNDGTTPPEFAGKTFASTHDHYLVSGAATVDSEDVEQLIDTIAEHGYGPAQGSQIVILANKQEVDKIRAFRANTVNNNSKTALYDFIPSAGQPTLILPSNGLLGSLPPTTWNGLAVVGSYGNALIIEESYIPAGYLVAFATGGLANLGNPIGFREHANPQMRGLRLINGDRAGYPIINSYYQRGFGTGIRHRGAGAILQVKASGSYTAPTQYS